MEQQQQQQNQIASESLNLICKLEGDFSEGIDVSSLAPMLAAMAELIRASNNTILATEKEIVVRVKPLKEGHFSSRWRYMHKTPWLLRCHI